MFIRLVSSTKVSCACSSTITVLPAAKALAGGQVDWAEPFVDAGPDERAAANRKDEQVIPENIRRKWDKLIK